MIELVLDDCMVCGDRTLLAPTTSACACLVCERCARTALDHGRCMGCGGGLVEAEAVGIPAPLKQRLAAMATDRGVTPAQLVYAILIEAVNRHDAVREIQAISTRIQEQLDGHPTP